MVFFAIFLLLRVLNTHTLFVTQEENMAKQYVYNFKDAYGLGKELLGGKGAGLAEMTHIGVTIPEGFTITTEACNLYYDLGKKLPEE